MTLSKGHNCVRMKYILKLETRTAAEYVYIAIV